MLTGVHMRLYMGRAVGSMWALTCPAMLSGPTCKLTHLTSTSLGSNVARSSSVCTPASGTYTCSAVRRATGGGGFCQVT